MFSSILVTMTTVYMCNKMNNYEDPVEQELINHSVYAKSDSIHNGLSMNIVDEGFSHGPGWYRPSKGLNSGGHRCFQ